MKKFIKVISAALLLSIGLSTFACGPKAEEPEEVEEAVASDPISEDILAGTWKGFDGEISTLTLGKNGSYNDDAGDGMYIKGSYTLDTVSNTMTVNESEYGMTFVYNVTLDGKILTLQIDGGLPRKFCKID